MENNSSKRGKYGQYDNENLNIAISDVKNKILSAYKASKVYKIPKQTILNRLKNPIVMNHGKSTVLTTEEELRLADWLVQCASMGFPRTRDDLISAAGEIIKLRPESKIKFKSETPSRQWVSKFMSRHRNISFRTPEAVSQAASRVSEYDIRVFFTRLRSYFESNGLQSIMDRAEAWINLDEKCYPLNTMPKKVIAEKGSKNVYQVETGKSKESLTVTHAFMANGRKLTSQIIFKKNYSNLPAVANACVDVGAKFYFSASENGWQTKETFFEYIKMLAEELKDIQKPIVITFDNHASHKNFEMFEWCKDQGIYIVTLPPYTTHILQVCDVALFGPANQAWSKEIHRWKGLANDELDFPTFVKLLKIVEDKVFTEEIIKNGFKGTGMFPLNIENVHMERVLGSSSATIEEPSHDAMIIDEIPIVDVSSIRRDLGIQVLECVILNPGDNSSSNENEIVTNFETRPIQIPPKSIEDILQVPTKPKKKTVRRYKMPNSGLMNIESVLEQKRLLDEEQLAQQREKDAKKKLREDKKSAKEELALIRTNKKRMKVENDTSSNVLAVKRPRGRPKKSN